MYYDPFSLECGSLVPLSLELPGDVCVRFAFWKMSDLEHPQSGLAIRGLRVHITAVGK